MRIINALKPVCDLLPLFALASLFKAFAGAEGMFALALVLTFVSSLFLYRQENMAVRAAIGLLPALSLLMAKGNVQLLTMGAFLLFGFALTVSGKNDIYYEDYKFWFGVPSVPMFVLLTVCITEHPDALLPILFSAAYLILGIIVLRRKRMGEGASTAAKLFNLGEVTGVTLGGTLGCAAVYQILMLLGPVLALLLLPFDYLLRFIAGGVDRVHQWLMNLDPEQTEEAAEALTTVSDELLYPMAPPAEEPVWHDYPWASALGKTMLFIVLLALLVIILFGIYRMIKGIRRTDKETDPAFERAAETEYGRSGRKKKRKKAAAPTNNQRVREIYRQYLSCVGRNGVTIVRHTTSRDVMEASEPMTAPGEAVRLRDIYIRARYNDDLQVDREEVREAEEILKAAKARLAGGR